jgi:hypothetical protein
MTSRPPGTLARIIERRAFVLEPLAIISIVSLSSTWAIQPYVAHALAQQGAAAQGAAQAAIWFSGVLSPLSALAKALAAALVCWACAVWLDERLPMLKLVSMFCIAEIVHSLRDLTMLGVLAARGIGSVRATSDLMVAFGLNAFLHPASSLARVGFESWDLFSVAWGFAIFLMMRWLMADSPAGAKLWPSS